VAERSKLLRWVAPLESVEGAQVEVIENAKQTTVAEAWLGKTPVKAGQQPRHFRNSWTTNPGRPA